MLTKPVILKQGVGLRNYAIVRNTAATLSETIQPNEETSIIATITQHKNEASRLRQELADLDCSTDNETAILWEYVLVTTKLENLRDTLCLEKLRAERRKTEQRLLKKPAESGVRCSEDVGDKNDDDIKENQESPNEVIYNASVDDDDQRMDEERRLQSDSENHVTPDPREQAIRKALSAVQEGGTVLNKAHCEIWSWLCAHGSNIYIPKDFQQMMEQHVDALGNDLVHITPRVAKEVADRLGGRAVGY